MQHTGFNASVCHVEGRALTASAQEDKETRELQELFFKNLSGFRAEVAHSSPTVSSFVKLLPTP